MSEETTEQTPEGSETVEEPKKRPQGRDQIPAHVPPSMRHVFAKHEGSVADKPGFRNKSNKNSMAQRKKKKRR